MRALVLCCCLALCGAGDAPFSGQVTLVLEGALLQLPDQPAEAANRKDLTVIATCRDGVWEECWGHALTFAKAQHRGVLQEAVIDETRLAAVLLMQINGDAWIPGGAGRWQVDLRRQGAELTGRYAGVSAYGPAGPERLEGTVRGRIDPVPARSPDFRPFAPDEFPRLLLRREDLPRLRQRLATPFGQAVRARLAASDDPVGLGLLYQLEEDPAHAQRAIAGVRATMAETGGGAFAVGRVWGYRAERVALAYDLCHDAWDEEVRREVGTWLDWITPRCIDRPWSLSSAVNITPGSNYMVVIWGGAGLAAITRIGPAGEPPRAPRDDFASARRITPPADWQPGAGVPVEVFVPEVMPGAWLWAGGWPSGDLGENDPLAALGGAEQAHRVLQAGTAIAGADEQHRFEAVPEGAFYRCSQGRFTHGAAFNLAELFRPEGGEKADSYFRTGWLYTVIAVEEERAIRVTVPDNNAAACDALWLSGQRLRHGDLCTLAPGLHPLLVRARSLDLIPNPWGAMLLEPRFVALSPERLQQLADGRAIELAVRRALHAADLAAWRDSGGADLAGLRLARRGARWNALNCQGSMGDGGFQAEGEGYTRECHRPLLDYALAHRVAFGSALSARPDASHFAPRYLATTVWTGSEERGQPAFRNQTWGGGGGTIEADYLGRCLPLCPEPWRASLLWFWHQRMGVAPGEAQQQAIAAVADWPAGIDLVQAFLHYPLDLAPLPPAGRLPLHWAAPGKGFHSFRNAYADGDDIVFQVYAKDGQGAGWSAGEAGGFQLQGLGQVWAAKAKHDRGGSRDFENVVQLPDDETAGGARCRVLRTVSQADGSGGVAIDLDPVYRVARPRPDHPKQKDWVDGGIAGWRGLAVDYSGRAGVPASFAIVDQITGGGRKVWTMHVPDLDPAMVTVEGQRFTIRQGDATLVGTVVTPAGAQISVGEQPGVAAAVGAGRANRSGTTTFTFRGLRISGPDEGAGAFFIVCTLQRGPAPVVAIDGAGLEATARLGKMAWRVVERMPVAVALGDLTD